MDTDTIIGCIVTSLALAILCVLVLWSRRRIERIARRGFGSARSTLRDLQRER